MSGAVGGLLIAFGWTVIVYLGCMLLDMAAFSRIGLAVIYPAWMESIEARFWTRLSLRHIVLVPLAFLLQYLIRRHVMDLAPASVACIALWVAYVALLVWDSLQYYVFPIYRARKSADL